MAQSSAQTPPTRLKPGVVTGDDYVALLAACKAGGYALPAVNVIGTNSINATLEAAARNKSDVIIQLSNAGARFFAGEGMADQATARTLGAISAARHVHLMAEHYGVCVVLHTDHADRGLVGWVDAMVDASARECDAAGRPLFSSHMLDLSEEPIDENLAECERMMKRLAPLGMSLEIELGVTGGEEDGIGQEHDGAVDNPKLYTQPEDVLQAYERLSPLGHFTVAASFGNVHGVYSPGNVKLRPEILRHSQALVAETHSTGPNPLDLVFHGGSGSETAKIEEAIGYGVFKMNIDTDTQFAFAGGVGRFVTDNPRAFEFQVDPDTGKPYKKLYNPRAWLRKGELAMADRLDQAFADLKATGKSLAG